MLGQRKKKFFSSPVILSTVTMRVPMLTKSNPKFSLNVETLHAKETLKSVYYLLGQENYIKSRKSTYKSFKHLYL